MKQDPGESSAASIAGGQDLNIGGETEDLIGASAAPWFTRR